MNKKFKQFKKWVSGQYAQNPDVFYVFVSSVAIVGSLVFWVSI